MLKLAGGKVKAQEKAIAAAGDAILAVKAKGKSKRKLAKKGKLKVKLEVTFTATGGEPVSKLKKAKLKRKR